MASPGDLWLAARSLGDEPEQQWTFPLLLDRHLALSSAPVAHMYEDVNSWAGLTSLMEAAEVLTHFGVPDNENISVSLGFTVHEEVLHSKDGRLMPATPTEPYRGRHNVAALGWDGNADEVVIRNSWGAGWGDNGLGYVSRSFFQAHVDSVVVRRAPHVGPSRAMNDWMRAETWRQGRAGRPAASDFPRGWRVENRIKAKVIQLDRNGYDLLMRELLDLENYKPLRLIELRDGYELAARAHLAEVGNKGGLLTEFWVPPGVRRRGFGRYLYDEIALLSGAIGYTELTLALNEADASERGIARAQGFADALGLELTPVTRKRPCVTAQATLSLA